MALPVRVVMEDEKENVEPKRKRDEPQDQDNQFRCLFPGCNESFHAQWSFTRHTRTHEGYKPHVCGVCNKGFVQKCSLDRHMATHSDNRPWNCPFCNETFKLKEYLKEHKKKQHTDIMNDVEEYQQRHHESGADGAEEAVAGSIRALTEQRDDARLRVTFLAKRLIRFNIRVEPEYLAWMNDL